LRFSRLVQKVTNRILYTLYATAVRIGQGSKVAADREPRFIQDDIVRPAEGTTLAIAVKYPLLGLDDGFSDLLEALARQRVDTVVVFNGEPSEPQLQTARRYAHRILVRSNLGRDFGGYRAATLKLVPELKRFSRVLYFNDSLIYLPGPELDQLIGAFRTSTYDVVGSFENHTMEHHVGSFAFSLAASVAVHPSVVSFWQSYKPYDLRPHAIANGEVKLSRTLKKLGCRFDVVYSITKLARLLERQSTDRLISLLEYIPSRPAFNVHSAASSQPLVVAESIEAMLEAASAGDHQTSRSKMSALRDTFIDHLLSSFQDHSQVHVGFGLFRRVMRCPLIKKDIVSHNIYLEHECQRILDDLPTREQDRILRQLIDRGRPVYPTPWRRFQLQNGLI
jgi:hypothetical protein